MLWLEEDGCDATTMPVTMTGSPTATSHLKWGSKGLLQEEASPVVDDIHTHGRSLTTSYTSRRRMTSSFGSPVAMGALDADLLDFAFDGVRRVATARKSTAHAERAMTQRGLTFYSPRKATGRVRIFDPAKTPIRLRKDRPRKVRSERGLSKQSAALAMAIKEEKAAKAAEEEAAAAAAKVRSIMASGVAPVTLTEAPHYMTAHAAEIELSAAAVVADEAARLAAAEAVAYRRIANEEARVEAERLAAERAAAKEAARKEAELMDASTSVLDEMLVQVVAILAATVPAEAQAEEEARVKAEKAAAQEAVVDGVAYEIVAEISALVAEEAHAEALAAKKAAEEAAAEEERRAAAERQAVIDLAAAEEAAAEAELLAAVQRAEEEVKAEEARAEASRAGAATRLQAVRRGQVVRRDVEVQRQQTAKQNAIAAKKAAVEAATPPPPPKPEEMSLFSVYALRDAIRSSGKRPAEFFRDNGANPAGGLTKKELRKAVK